MATIVPDSLDAADVQAAVTAASSCDTIALPSGTADWDGNAVTVPEDKNLNIVGAGEESTVLTDAVIELANTASQVASIGFDSPTERTSLYTIKASGLGWRVHHCHFHCTYFNSPCAVKAYIVYDYHPYGLIDHCKSYNGRMLIDCYGDIASPLQHKRWRDAITLGQLTDVVYIEDNEFYGPGTLANAVDCNRGGRFVFRHNTATDMYVEAHAPAGEFDNRGTRYVEVYNNTLIGTGAYWHRAIFIRAGTGVIFNNVMTGQPVAMAIDHRRNYELHCDGTSPWDGNTAPIETYRGYPGRDQIGRGRDAWEHTTENPYPTQALEPMYFWGNVWNGNPVEPTPSNIAPYGDLHIVEDRDYYNSAMPAYTPGTYPHPLQGVTGGEGIDVANELVMVLR